MFDEQYRISGGYKKIQSKKFVKCLDNASSLTYDTNHASATQNNKKCLHLVEGLGKTRAIPRVPEPILGKKEGLVVKLGMRRRQTAHDYACRSR